MKNIHTLNKMKEIKCCKNAKILKYGVRKFNKFNNSCKSIKIQQQLLKKRKKNYGI